MKMQLTPALASLLLAGIAAAGVEPWITFEDESAARLIAEPQLGLEDPDQKAYAWGDLDQDGDIDLVVVRYDWVDKRPNVLFMNEGVADGHAMNGLLVDRTAEFASASDIEGDAGFLTPTSDADVVLVDVNGDGWLDVVTATTRSDGEPKHIKMPRVYMNLGEDGDGRWLGLRYEDARIADFSSPEQPDAAPLFNAVAAGDLNGDGSPDLHFADSDYAWPFEQLHDFNNVVLLNDGRGSFIEATDEALPFPGMANCSIGTATAIADFNNDGFNDIMKAAKWPPGGLAVIYNNPDVPGTMSGYNTVHDDDTYFASADDLNNDGLLDMIFIGAFQKRALTNVGIGADGMADFIDSPILLADGSMGSSFKHKTRIADIDGDGWKDAIVTSLPPELQSCSNVMHIYRNFTPGVGEAVHLQEHAVPPIPEAHREGVHDAAVFDLNGDGLNDIILGRCNTTGVWIQQPQRCPANFDEDATVGTADLLQLLSAWGDCEDLNNCAEDLDADDTVGVADLLQLLSNWGPCE